jgi:hypothetical protein
VQREAWIPSLHNDALGLVWRSSYGHPMLDYSGGDTDASTYMARFPEEHFTIILSFEHAAWRCRRIRRTQCWTFSIVGASCRDSCRVPAIRK